MYWRDVWAFGGLQARAVAKERLTSSTFLVVVVVGVGGGGLNDCNDYMNTFIIYKCKEHFSNTLKQLFSG